jgi:hypothetical protein
MDRPYISNVCAGYVDSSVNQKRSLDYLVEENQLLDLAKRQTYDPNRNIVPTIPGCHDRWVGFLVTYYQAMYYFSFAMIPFSLIVFVTSVLTANHLYMD